MNRHKHPKWQKHSRSRAKYEAKRRGGTPGHGAFGVATIERGSLRGAKLDDRYRIHLIAPANLSLINNFPDTQNFLGELKARTDERKYVYIELQDVTEVSIETILVLNAIIKASPHPNTTASLIRGNSPKNQRADSLLYESGFYEQMASARPKRTLREQKGSMHKRKGFKAEPALAAEISQKAGKCLFGDDRYVIGLAPLIIEAMGNTKQHANPQEESTERWWIMAFCDPETKSAKFAFYDSGVGILRSLRGKLASWFAANTPFVDRDEDVLHDIMHGMNRSRTGIPYRGKGLPSMAKALERGHVQNLKIITNRTFGNVAEDSFLRLPVEFPGTLIYWEAGNE